MMHVFGMDGCRAGWFAVEAACSEDGDVHELRPHLFPSFGELLRIRPRPPMAAVDMPIGLLPMQVPGGRACDRLARESLGERRSSVFSAPTRDLLQAREWAEVHGMSKQSFHLLPKVRDVDEQLTPARQRWIRETHPELVFARLAGAPMAFAKRTAEGRRARLAVLQRITGLSMQLFEQAATSWRRSQVALDDIVDALALAIAARDMVLGTARRLPERAPRDPRGLRMQIWA